ncbi:MAG: glycoside hydrolase domain-containing protein [Candidatus Sigynarchaeum springense]
MSTIQRLSLSRLAGFAFAYWTFTFLMYHNSAPVAKQLDFFRLMEVVLFTGALAGCIAYAILFRIPGEKARNVLRVIITAATFGSMLVFCGLLFYITSWNHEAALYTYGYAAVYYTWLYMFVLGCSYVFFFACILDALEDYRKAPAMAAKWDAMLGGVLFPQVLASLALLLAGLLLVKYALLGLAYGVMAIAGMSRVWRSGFRPLPVLDDDKALPGVSTLPGPNRFNFGFFVVGMIVLQVIIGYMWPLQFVRFASPAPGEDVMTLYYVLNKRTVLDDALVTIGITWIVAFVSMLSIRRSATSEGSFLHRVISHVASHAHVWATGIVTILALYILWMSAGVEILYLRASNVMTPMLIAMEFFFLLQVIRFHPRAPHGILSFLFILGGTCFWTSFLLGSSPESDYAFYYFLAAAAISGTFLMLTLVPPKARASVTPSNQVKVSTTPPARLAQEKRTGSTSARPISRVLFVLTIIGVSGFFIGSAVQSVQSFPVLANVDNNCIFYLASPFNRVDRYYFPGAVPGVQFNVNNQIPIEMARNEYESIQIVMRPINQLHFSVYAVSFSGFDQVGGPAFISPAAAKFKPYVMEYVEALSNVIADRLVPFYPMTVADGLNHPMWFTFYVPPATPAGEYEGNLSFVVDKKWDSGWADIQTIKFIIKLRVFDFKLPDVPTLASNFGLSGIPEDTSLFNETMQIFQEHRMMLWTYAPLPQIISIQANGTPSGLNFTAMDAFYDKYHAMKMNTFGIWFSPQAVLPGGTFIVDGSPYDAYTYSTCSKYNSTIAAYWAQLEAHLKSKTRVDEMGRNTSWYDETYYNGRDELDAAPAHEITYWLAFYRWLKYTLNMTIPIMQTMGDSPEIRDVVDIIVHHTSGHVPYYFAEWQAAGKQIWIYTTGGPGFPFPTINTASFAVQQRALGWQTFIYNYTHYLIWSINTPYNTADGLGYQGWNGGTLTYFAPGGGYYISSRLELVRDGFEDHDYFELLRFTIGNLTIADPSNPKIQVGRSLLSRVTSLMNEWKPEMDYRAFNALRAEIGTFLGGNCPVK